LQLLHTLDFLFDRVVILKGLIIGASNLASSVPEPPPLVLI
jgi:hypothetical protein